MLEALGLVVELRLPDPGRLGAGGLIRVRCELAGAFTMVSPWTRYECAEGRFLPSPAEGSDLARGMVNLGRGHWQFATFDVAGGIDRLRDAARTVQEETVRAATPEGASLPALRSAGLNLMRADRRSQFDGRAAAAATRRGSLARTVLHADDLVLGYRVNVRTSDGNWGSLMRRSAPPPPSADPSAPPPPMYATTDGIPIVDADHEEEGQVKAHGMTVEDGSDDPSRRDRGVDPRSFRADEVVVRWDGWSLAVPRTLDRPNRRGRAEGRAQLPFLRWAFQAVALPELRFGRLYRLRARVADFAGGGLRLGDPELTEGESQEVFYSRHDPVPPPVLVPPDPLVAEPPRPEDVGPGGAVNVLVIRSDPLTDGTLEQFAARYPANDRRMLLPPAGPFALAEAHEMLDGQDPLDCAAWLRRALTPHAFTADGSYSWLPDPVAEGVAMFIRPEPGAPSPGATAKEAWTVPSGRWPDVPAKSLVLQAATAAGQSTLDWTNGGLSGVVRLPAGRQVSLELTSSIVPDDVDNFEMKNWLSAPVDPPQRPGADPLTVMLERVRDGRHPMASPSRAVRMVHATQRPVRKPAGTLAAIREPGSTLAVIADPAQPKFDLDAPSTAQVELSARWDEWNDDVMTSIPPEPLEGEPPPAPVSIDVVRLDADATEAPPLRHEFADTRHRMVEYTVTATSRFRQYFAEAGDDQFQAPPLVQRVDVRSTARPPAPAVLSVTPAFRWTGRETPDGWQALTRTRAGGVVRIELARPWHASGDGEQLGVLVAEASETADVRRFVTAASRDPIWATPVVPGGLRTDMFAGLASGDEAVSLDETGAVVRAIPFEVHFAPAGDGRTARWYADVEIPVLAAMSYCPFVRLAVARYQRSSLPGLELSRMVRAEPVQLLPERRLDVTRAADSIQIMLTGQGPVLAQDAELGGGDSPDMPMANHVLAYLERLPAQAGRPDVTAVAADRSVGWQRVPGANVRTSMTERPVGEFTGVVSGDCALAIPPGAEPLRLVVREIEWFPGAPSIVELPADEVHERTVFADVIPLR